MVCLWHPSLWLSHLEELLPSFCLTLSLPSNESSHGGCVKTGFGVSSGRFPPCLLLPLEFGWSGSTSLPQIFFLFFFFPTLEAILLASRAMNCAITVPRGCPGCPFLLPEADQGKSWSEWPGDIAEGSPSHSTICICWCVGKGLFLPGDLLMEGQLASAGCKQSWAHGDCGAWTWRPSFASHLDLHGNPSAPSTEQCTEADGKGSTLLEHRMLWLLREPADSTHPWIAWFYVHFRVVPRQWVVYIWKVLI